ncbi:MAG: hypothetical protein GY946_28125, partial [bacterium]|nr:hypothetical protein [bacterium]
MRLLSLLLSILLALSAGSDAAGQVIDIETARSIVAQCPNPPAGELAPGISNAFLCDTIDSTGLDGPHRTGAGNFDRVPSGSFNKQLSLALLAGVRDRIGEAEYFRLLGLLGSGEALTSGEEHLRRALLRRAAELDAASDASGAQALRDQAADLVEGKFDEAIPSLIQARADRARLEDLKSGLLQSVDTVDTVTSHGGLAASPSDTLTGVPPGLNPEKARVGSIPFFVSADGVPNTADDLPFLTGGLVKAPPIVAAGSPFPDSVFLETAQIANPSGTGTLELYGVFNPRQLRVDGCQRNSPSPFGGSGTLSFDFATGTCANPATGVSIPDLANVDESSLTPEQVEFAAFLVRLGCDEEAEDGRSSSQQIGINADGDCIRVNSAGPPGTQRPFDLLPLLADPRFRPAGADREPTNLTDYRNGDARLPARPQSPSGTPFFPGSTASARLVDPNTGAPVTAAGTSCTYRKDAGGVVVGPNGIAGDGDDVFPTAGDGCLLWVSDGPGTDRLRIASEIAGNHHANQSLFHTACTVAFDADSGDCPLAATNAPTNYAFFADTLSGRGVITGIAFPGIETIRIPAVGDSDTPLSTGLTSGLFKLVDPLRSDSGSFQQLDRSLEERQKALFGCGAGFATPCHALNQLIWANDQAIAAAINPRPEWKLFTFQIGGGIDFMNSAGDALTSA